MPGSNKDLVRKLEKRGYTPAEISHILESKQRRAKKPAKALRSRSDERSALRDTQRKIDQDWRDQQERDRAAWRARQAELEDRTYRQLSPDDTGHKPSTPDPLTTGLARASGITAKAVSRSRHRAITKHEYDRMSSDG
jgi:hypothetical protein